MDLGLTAIHAAIEGFCTVLPVSASGHQLAARLWLGGHGALSPWIAVAQLGAAAAIFLVVRRRLGAAVAEGIRGIARPAGLQEAGGRDAVAVMIGSLVAATTYLGAGAFVSPVNAVPIVTGVGLLLTAASLASTWAAPPPENLTPSASGAVLVGLAFGLAILPGMSAVGAAYVVLRWLGVTAWRSAEMALLVALPALVLGSARLLLAEGQGLEAAGIALAATIAFGGALLGASFWRALCERQRTPLFGLWLLPLALAIIGYGRALPHPTHELPIPTARAEGDTRDRR